MYQVEVAGTTIREEMFILTEKNRSSLVSFFFLRRKKNQIHGSWTIEFNIPFELKLMVLSFVIRKTSQRFSAKIKLNES